MAGPVFQQEQRRVALRMLAAIVMTTVAMSAALHFGASGVPRPLAERLAAALQADLFVVLTLAAAVGNVARLRFFSASDTGGSSAGPPTPAVRHAAAVLQNTLEQVVLAVPVHLATASLLEHPGPLLATLTGLFVLGRALFWAGYAGGAGARALGFALTFYPTVGGLLVCLVALLRQWAG